MNEIIGRKAEIQQLNHLMASQESEFLALYGRRRVGKTYLIRNILSDNSIYFELTGQKDATVADQLLNFSDVFSASFRSGKFLTRPTSWRDAFALLASEMETSKKKGKKVIFLDELPWLASPRSCFLQALDYFWNHWASKRNDIILVVCGSAASWMIRKVIHHRGGLHNRITAQMRLLPFSLEETKEYLEANGVLLESYQVVELYMAMGGVPHYLRHIRKGESVTQLIDRICFSKDGALTDEFPKLFTSLFEHPEPYVDIVRALARVHRGMTRDDIIKSGKLSSGGGMTTILNNLDESGFIGSYVPFGKSKKEALYYLTDEYCLFYLTWIEVASKNVLNSPPSGYWLDRSHSPSWKSWSGYAFERICQKHMEKLTKAFGISGIYSTISSWHHRPKDSDERGVQIDLLIDRSDRTVMICEIKFSRTPFKISKNYATQLQEKIDVFRQFSGTKKSIFLAIVTGVGLISNDYATQLVHQQATLEDLF
jgi:uncharacterized protein